MANVIRCDKCQKDIMPSDKTLIGSANVQVTRRISNPYGTGTVQQLLHLHLSCLDKMMQRGN